MTSMRISGTTYDMNARGVIDLTDRYNIPSYMRGGPEAWLISTPIPEVTAIIVHHWAGWFGSPLTASAMVEQELARIDSLADYHSTTWGIGPGYNLVAFPSGRIYAVGKHGTHRAHTKGRRPAAAKLDRWPWNYVGRSVVAAGNWDTEEPPFALISALRRGVEEIQSWPSVSPAPVVYPHRWVPTVASNNVPFEQATACPGRYILPHMPYITGQRVPELPAEDSYAALMRELGAMMDEQALALDEANDYLAAAMGWTNEMRKLFS